LAEAVISFELPTVMLEPKLILARPVTIPSEVDAVLFLGG
jgi:hypothetical protein